MYPIQLVSEHLLLTLSRALYLRFGLPTQFPFDSILDFSRINPQVLYHSHAVITAKPFKSV